jgi:hypothetical protein
MKTAVFFLFLLESLFVYGQARSLDIHIPNSISRGGDNQTVVYRITTNEQGIINSIRALNDKDYIVPEIIVSDRIITISSDRRVYSIKQIEIDEKCLYVKGGERSIFTQDGNQSTTIFITPAENVIYEHDEVRLEIKSDKFLEEIFKINPSRFSGISFSENTSIIDYRYKNNPQNKFIYENRDGIIFMTYYRMMGGEFEEYRSRIKIEGSIYCDSIKTNIINYFIVYSAHTWAASMLFPLIFLDNPFSSPGWVYRATSYLTEGNVIYAPDNLGSEDGLPWASSNGNGIGDKIVIDTGISPVNSIVIINGFVSKEKPYLFLANSRAGQIKIKNLNNGITKNITLKDSPAAESIDISELRTNKNTQLELEILSVYPGNKYQDLCIQSILPGSIRK